MQHNVAFPYSNRAAGSFVSNRGIIVVSLLMLSLTLNLALWWRVIPFDVSNNMLRRQDMPTTPSITGSISQAQTPSQISTQTQPSSPAAFFSQTLSPSPTQIRTQSSSPTASFSQTLSPSSTQTQTQSSSPAASFSPTLSPSPTQSPSCPPLPPLNHSHLAVDWGTTEAHVLQAASRALELFDCADNIRSFTRAVFLLAKDVTELDAERGFKHVTMAASPVVSEPAFGEARFLAFFLTSASKFAVNFRDRVDRLLDDGDVETHSDFAATLDAFIAANPAWRNTTTSYISLLANPRLRRAMISRVQITGLCFLHAPLVALHYAINMQSQELNSATVDITTALRHNFEDGILGSYLFADRGAIVRDLIRTVFAPEPGVAQPEVLSFAIHAPSSALESKRDYEDLLSMLATWGVGIIIRS